jgi:hypothetical protein
MIIVWPLEDEEPLPLEGNLLPAVFQEISLYLLASHILE